ncbi:hypothetical protein [Yersinia enterocolitica]|uniref:hypothetical protein n=1 Tax=Yersinia enterocolitica TaxID=630 RepID=UPI003D7B58BA
MLILWFLSWIKAGFIHNSTGAGEDLRKLGLGMIGAGFFGFFLEPSHSKSVILVLLGLLTWLIGLVLSAPKQNIQE